MINAAAVQTLFKYEKQTN